MTKKNLIFSLLLLFAFISGCYLSASPVNTGVEADDERDKMSISILSTPKSSGHVITELWNDTMDEVNCVAVSADGKYMAVVTEDGINHMERLLFYNTTNHGGEPMWSFELMALNFSSLAISGNGSYIVAGSKEAESIALFNITGDVVWTALLGGTPPISVDISEDGKFIVAGGKTGPGGYVIVFDNSIPAAGPGNDKYGSNEYEWFYVNPSGLVTSVAISADGKSVVAGTDYNSDDEVFFWNNTEYTKGAPLSPMWSADAQEPISSLGISAEGSSIVAGTSTGVGYLYNWTKPGAGQEKLPIWYINYSSESILSTDISRDGKYAVFGRDSGCVDVYDNSSDYFNDNKTDEYLWLYEAEGGVYSVDISADGKYIVAGTKYNPDTGDENENTIFLFENAGYKVGDINDPEWFFNTSYDVNSVSISANGSYIAAGGKYNPVIDFGIAYLFYHEVIPTPRPGLPIGDDDDDDDDDDTGFTVIVPFIIVIASIGIGVVVLVVLIKKGVIFRSKSKLKR